MTQTAPKTPSQSVTAELEQAPLLAGYGMTKSFGDLVANKDIDFTIHAGELHALLGENGAGKSTFIKMIYGLLEPDQGHLEWQGESVTISNPQQARAMGIGMVFQHFSLFDALTVAENIALALPPDFPRQKLSQLISTKSAEYGIPLNPDNLVADLSVGQQQRVEIVRCLLQNPALLIMDEPTSVLTPQETDQLFEVLRRLAEQGCAVLFISHKLDEIKQLTSRATILRGGVKVAEVKTGDQSKRQLAELMIGAKVKDMQAQSTPKTSKTLLTVTGLSRPADGPFNVALRDINLSVRAGEILGIAGIAGNGQSELMDALTGEWRPSYANASNMIQLGADDITTLSPAGRRRAGLAFVPEERNGHAAVPSMTLSENTLLTGYDLDNVVRGGMINHDQTLAMARQISKTYDVRQPSDDPLASSLSGGNLQKFVVGREIIKSPDVLIVSQPTWGVDIGAAQFIRTAMAELAKQGSAVIMISQDLEEIFQIAHQITVLNAGQLSATFKTRDITAERIGLLMGGSLQADDNISENKAGVSS
jgi:simple sugar transport system ATP-binding protein